VRVLLDPPVAASGTLSGFRVWQATETVLIDFALEMAKTAAERDAIERLARLLRRTTNMPLRAQLLKNRISPILINQASRTAFFSKFDAVSDRIWAPDGPVELELSARHDGIVVLLFTGISTVGVETSDVTAADLGVYAVPDRISENAPILQVIASLDSGDGAPNCCLLVAGSRQPLDAGTLRIFWDTGEEIVSENEVIYQLDGSRCFALSDTESSYYLEDIDELSARMGLPYHQVFLALLPESWNLHCRYPSDVDQQSRRPDPESEGDDCILLR
jgi:hypothetical protein